MTHHNEHSQHQKLQPWRDLPEGMAEYLALEAQLGATVVDAAIEYGVAAMDEAPSKILDLGSGAGGATLALANRFPGAEIHGLDVSAQLLERLAAAATAAGVQSQVHGHLIDLDDDWTDTVQGRVDMVWAALSLHHVAHPGKVLQRAYSALRPGGVLVVTELTGQESFRTQDQHSGSDNLIANMNYARAGHGHRSADWSTQLTEAGFTSVVLHETEFTVRADTAEGQKYLARQLQFYAQKLAATPDANQTSELDAALQALESGTSTLSFHSGRAIWVAVRRESRDVTVD